MSNKLNGLSKSSAMLLIRALEFYAVNQDKGRLDPEIRNSMPYLLSQLDSIIKHHEHTEANWYGPGKPLVDAN